MPYGCVELPLGEEADRQPIKPNLPMLSLSLDCDYVREDVPSVKEDTPSSAFMELDSDGSVPSVSVFLMSSVLMVTILAGGTSMWDVKY